MFVTGHIGAAYLAHRLSGLRLKWLLGAAVFPDLVDKGLRLAGLFEGGRHLAHNLFALLLTATLVGLLWDRRAGWTWALGYVLHLVGDLPFSWDMPWFFPFEFGAWKNSVETGFMNLAPGQIALDLLVSTVAVGLMVKEKVRRVFWRRRAPTKAIHEGDNDHYEVPPTGPAGLSEMRQRL